MSLNSSRLNVLLICATLLAMLPEFLMRSNLDIMYWFYSHFSTYFGDLWYCWDNFLAKDFPYPREYPSLIQLIFRGIYLIPEVTTDYSLYIIFPVALLAIAATLNTHLMHHLGASSQRLVVFWILAPSFLFYSLLNLDLLPIVTILYSYLFFNSKRYHLCALSLAVGTAIKVFPIFLFPVYFFAAPKDKRFEMILFLVIIWFSLNLPFMTADWDAWKFTYVMQIQQNFARTSSDGSWTWILYQLFEHYGIGSWSGKVSLVIFATAYFLIMKHFWHLSLIRRLTIVIILFLLTDKVYSPQYNLYLLPFLVLLDFQIKLRWFYLLEIPNFIQGFFLFAIKNQPVLLQGIIFVKYFALLFLLISILRNKKD